jgi:hypothetical protein
MRLSRREPKKAHESFPISIATLPLGESYTLSAAALGVLTALDLDE